MRNELRLGDFEKGKKNFVVVVVVVQKCAQGHYERGRHVLVGV